MRPWEHLGPFLILALLGACGACGAPREEDHAEHGEEEHAEGHEALLAVLESGQLDGDEFDDLVEELAKVVNHHLTEEELTILNPAREEVGDRLRSELGEKFATERNRQIDDGCGSVTQIRGLVAAARREGLLDEDDEKAEGEKG